VNRVKALRIEKNWTQDELGEKLNVKRAAISKYESCKIPLTDETLIKLSEIFNLSTDYILGISNSRINSSNEGICEFENICSAEEKELLSYYRRLSDNMKMEIKGEMKGILRATQQEQSAAKEVERDFSKRAI